MPELVVSNLCADGFGKARGTIVPGQRLKQPHATTTCVLTSVS